MIRCKQVFSPVQFIVDTPEDVVLLRRIFERHHYHLTTKVGGLMERIPQEHEKTEYYITNKMLEFLRSIPLSKELEK